MKKASQQVLEGGMALHAGHGLTYRNVRPIAAIDGMHELNIGHSIIARAVLVGLETAVREMKCLILSLRLRKIGTACPHEVKSLQD